MEDAATAEISRAQLWQWLHHSAKLNDGRQFTTELFEKWLNEELNIIQTEIGENRFKEGKFEQASTLFSDMIKKNEFDEFLTVPAYELLN